MTEKKTVTVTIYKNEYTLKGEAEPQQIIDLAKYVDTRMTEMGRKSSAPADKIAILVAMNIADELHRLEKNNEENLTLIESLEKNLEEMKTSSDITIKNAAIQNEETNRLRDLFSEEKQKLQAVLEQRNQADRLIEDLKRQIETLSGEAEKIKASFNGSQNATLELQNALEQQKINTASAEAEISELKAQCGQLKLELSEAKEALQKELQRPTGTQLSQNDVVVSAENLNSLIKKIEALLD
jgi:cell division protein ZapA